MQDRTCTVEGCARTPRSNKADLCNAHYFRQRRKGDVGTAEISDRQRKPCAIPDCNSPSVGHGYCSKHHQRLRAHGDPAQVTPHPAGAEHPCWKAEQITYSAAHMRVRALHGLPRSHACVSCGKQAKHWAYDHKDPNELRCSNGPYSANPDHYLALCVPCHKSFDLRWLVATASVAPLTSSATPSSGTPSAAYFSRPPGDDYPE